VDAVAKEEFMQIVIEDLVERLVDRNILPAIDGLVLYISDTFYNRQVLFCELYHLGYSVDDKILSIEDGIITLDFTEKGIGEKVFDRTVPELKKTGRIPETCFIFNNEYEVLSQKLCGEKYFSSSSDEAIAFYKRTAVKLVQEICEKCFFIEVYIDKSDAQAHHEVLKLLLNSKKRLD
jgi:hypothetical protein